MERAFVPMAMLLALLISTGSVAAGGGGEENTWTLSDPILSSGPNGTFSGIAVKDPSIVYFEGMWHVFFTARGTEASTTGYVSAKNLAGLQSAPRHELARTGNEGDFGRQSAPRHELEMIRGKSRYGCAPQVLYYRPHGKWYLIFQNRDARYQPVFSTTTTISKSGVLDQARAADPERHGVEVDRLLDHLRQDEGLSFLHAKPKHRDGQDHKSGGISGRLGQEQEGV